MIREGTEVQWKWGSGFAEGTVKETFSETVTKTIYANEITRHGEPGNKALFIEQDDGTEVLKLESEVIRKI